jgi:flagellar motor switch protein FliN/FliY
MAEENEFQESNLSEEQLDAILSSNEEDTLSSLLNDASSTQSTKNNQDQPLDEISSLLSNFGDSDSFASQNLQAKDFSDRSIITSSTDIQKSGIPIKELYDINVKLSVELGRTFMYIKDILLLGEGSIVELDKNVGDEVDILINDRLFARGKLVIVDEFYGVQITQILHPAYFNNI